MPTRRVTVTRAYNTIRFADPYKKCDHCHQWVDGALVKEGPLVVIPCEHEAHYRDICPSWGPVDGCSCTPGQHQLRTPAPDDDRKY